ncbi:hypothetical protein C2G38_2155620 [Gigaspora rosea]|uniref:Proteasome component Ecm29 N-terminal domain-containing protein n=1 Tax=Gigaspora rosea TaxID=44941 RepID=A0A397W3R9_9GLOM|nr:hypothetical protein C2G38_2155620 [Gigaspora rosea]
MANNEIQLLENIEIQFVFAENEVQFEEKLKNFLSHVLKELASPHEIVRKKAIEILNHIKKRMTKTVKLPRNLLAELVCSENFMQFTLLKNFTIMFLKTAYNRLTENDKIMYMLPLIENIELKSDNMKKFLFQIILEFFQKLRLKLADLETKEIVDSLYSLYECSRVLSCEKELLCQSQSLKFEIMCYLCKSKLAANIFPFMLHVSFDCLYSPKTDTNLQKKGVDFIKWITRMVDTSIVELIGKVLLIGLLKIIKDNRTEKFNNLLKEQEINQSLLFKPFYGSPDLSIHNSEEDNENFKVIIIIKFHELNQLDQFDQWTNEENVQEIINILEKNIDELANGMLNIGYEHENGIGDEKDEHKAFIYYQKFAEMGNDNGINYVGHCYRQGIGVEKDEHKAFIYYQKSAEMGNADGINNLGYCYQHGIGVEKDEHKAFIYYQKSAEMEMGNADGINSLGNCYRHGIGVEKDEYKAFIYYQKSAEMGNGNGINNVGNCYKNGIGVEKDEYKAFIYYQISAEMGCVVGINNLGYYYREGIGIEKDEHKAFIYYKKSAEMGNADGINNLGYFHQHGIGVEKDEYKAFIYYKKSAEIGNAGGTYNVGYCYDKGIGVEKHSKNPDPPVF